MLGATLTSVKIRSMDMVGGTSCRKSLADDSIPRGPAISLREITSEDKDASLRIRGCCTLFLKSISETGTVVTETSVRFPRNYGFHNVLPSQIPTTD
jgi:hypothetical protein